MLLANPPYGRRAEAIGAEPDALLSQVLSGARGWSFALAYPNPDAVAAVPGVTLEAVRPVRMRGLRNALIVGGVADATSAPDSMRADG